MGARLIDDFIRNILSVPFCPCHFVQNNFVQYHFFRVPFFPYHFVRYHFVLDPVPALSLRPMDIILEETVSRGLWASASGRNISQIWTTLMTWSFWRNHVVMWTNLRSR